MYGGGFSRELGMPFMSCWTRECSSGAGQEPFWSSADRKGLMGCQWSTGLLEHLLSLSKQVFLLVHFPEPLPSCSSASVQVGGC